MDRHPEVLAICFADNVVLLGLAKDVLAAQHDLEAQRCRDLSTTPNFRESYFYAPAWTEEGLTMGTIPAAFRATAARVAPDLAARLDAIIRLEGITVLGYPLGSEVLNKLLKKICKHLPTLEQLDDGLAYLHLLRFCLIPRLSYALRAPCATISRPCAEAFDTAILNSLRKYAGMHTPAYKTPASLDATPEQVTRWLRVFTFGDTHEGFPGLPLIELTTPVAYFSAHMRFIRWVTTLHDTRHILPGGANVYAADSGGYTPLHMTAETGHTHVNVGESRRRLDRIG